MWRFRPVSNGEAAGLQKSMINVDGGLDLAAFFRAKRRKGNNQRDVRETSQCISQPVRRLRIFKAAGEIR